MQETTQQIDRLALRHRPEGEPIMQQTWEDLLFMHWAIDANLLRPLIPPELTLDTYNGQAWIGVTPFTLNHVHANGLPEIPGLASFHELNVRTYVHLDGQPGVWFLSLDASKTIPVLAARIFYALPYRKAEITLKETGNVIDYRLHAEDRHFEASWKWGEMLPAKDVESLDFFLTERYCLYAMDGGQLLRARIYHVPWPLREAQLISYRSTMIASHGLPEPTTEPLLHFSKSITVDIWGPHPA